jgi:hypothetical protein
VKLMPLKSLEKPGGARFLGMGAVAGYFLTSNDMLYWSHSLQAGMPHIAPFLKNFPPL